MSKYQDKINEKKKLTDKEKDQEIFDLTYSKSVIKRYKVKKYFKSKKLR